MNSDELKKKQSEMPNDVLIEKIEHQITELAKTGGRSHIMCVPPEITDTDMILSEMVRRFKELEQQLEKEREEIIKMLDWALGSFVKGQGEHALDQYEKLTQNQSDDEA